MPVGAATLKLAAGAVEQQAVERLATNRHGIPVQDQAKQRSQQPGAGDVRNDPVQAPRQQDLKREEHQGDAAEHQLGHDGAPEVVGGGESERFDGHREGTAAAGAAGSAGLSAEESERGQKPTKSSAATRTRAGNRSDQRRSEGA